MKLAIIRGTNLNPWEMQFYSRLKEYDIFPTGICAKDNAFDVSAIDMPVTRLKRVKNINKIPGLSHGISYFFCVNERLINLKKTLKDFDVVNTVESYNTFSFQAVKSGKPVVVTSWETIPFNNQRTMYKHFKNTVNKEAKHFIAVSKKAKLVLMKEGVNEERISVVPAGLDTERFSPMEKDREMLEKLNIDKDKKIVLFAGRLEESKGILDLAKAMQGINAILLVAGSGPLKDEIKKQSKRIDIRLLDSIPYSDMPKVHNLADIFCLPSRPTKRWEEQFGYVLVEAMSCGKPVISTTSGAIPEVVSDDRVLVGPGNVQGFHHLIKTILDNDELRKRLGKKNRERAETVFKDSIVAEKLAKVFNGI